MTVHASVIYSIVHNINSGESMTSKAQCICNYSSSSPPFSFPLLLNSCPLLLPLIMLLTCDIMKSLCVFTCICVYVCVCCEREREKDVSKRSWNHHRDKVCFSRLPIALRHRAQTHSSSNAPPLSLSFSTSALSNICCSTTEGVNTEEDDGQTRKHVLWVSSR